jgi:Mn2+/Fe2+ NRAMP family transporter
MRPLAGPAAYWLFTLGLIGTGMLGVPVLVGSCAYAIAEACAWRGSLEDKPNSARRFYAVVALAMLVGLLLDVVGFNAVAMLFWSAVVNGVLAPPLIMLVLFLTSDREVMATRVNPPLLRWVGWATAATMSAAAVAMIVTAVL